MYAIGVVFILFSFATDSNLFWKNIFVIAAFGFLIINNFDYAGRTVQKRPVYKGNRWKNLNLLSIWNEITIMYRKTNYKNYKFICHYHNYYSIVGCMFSKNI